MKNRFLGYVLCYAGAAGPTYLQESQAGDSSSWQ